tara:strand:+ start:22 stop:912 length:891 start_codon:yes stop_codon:yes gene_type:complete
MSNLTDFFGYTQASQINEVVFLKDTVDVLTTGDGRVYLKGGVYEIDLTLYPDATTTLLSGGVNFSFANETTYVDAMCSDGTHLYLVNQNEDKVYKYTKAGVYVAVYNTSPASSPYAIEWDGTHFWVGSNLYNIYQYDASFTQVGSAVSLTAELGSNGIRGIAWDGTHFYVMSETRQIFKYNSSWVYQSVTWTSQGQASYTDGMTSDGTHIYTYAGAQSYYRKIFKYTNTGTYLGAHAEINAGNDGVIAWDGTYFRAANPATDTVYQVQPVIGIANYTYGTSGVGQAGEGQNYVRVK